MPTPFELQKARPRQSIFANYPSATSDGAKAASPPVPDGAGPSPSARPAIGLQAAIDIAVARTFLHGLLARVFEDPSPEAWRWLVAPETAQALRSAAGVVGGDSDPGWFEAVARLQRLVNPSGFELFAADHLTCFGHTVRGDCPMNEIEYGDLKADPLFQPHRLADLGAFFAAFGMELAPDAAERIDHVSIELEFMSVLAAKEARALEHQFDEDTLDVLRDAQRKFLREHLGRWTPAFARRLARQADAPGRDSFLAAAARLLGEFVRIECARFALTPGSEDLLLRPADESGERLCDSCGLRGLSPAEPEA